MSRAFVVEGWTRAFVEGENRDAFAARFGQGGATLRVAIGDGASSTLFSGRWAHCLVERIVDDPGMLRHVDSVIAAARARFNPLDDLPDVDPRVKHRWLAVGSHSTLVAVDARLDGRHTVCLDVVAVGDSVLFVIGAGKAQVFPQLSAADFGATPELVASNSTGAVRHQTSHLETTVNATFVLATDGAAKPLLRLIEDEGSDVARDRLAALCNDASVDALGRALSVGDCNQIDDDATVVIFAATTTSSYHLPREVLEAQLRVDSLSKSMSLSGRVWPQLAARVRAVLGERPRFGRRD